MKKIIATILLALVICSCGARKTDKTRTSVSSKMETTDNTIIEKQEESNVKVTENTKVDDKDETTTKESTYEPVDPTKPASVIEENGKKTVLDNAKKTTKETTQKNNTKTDSAKNTEKVEKKALAEKKGVTKKSDTKKANEEIHIDKKAWSVFNLLWLLIPIGLIILAVKNRMKIAGWIESLWWV